MYLVELRPGKEELYRTGDELAAAIRSGDVDMHSRIYHRATSKWISVTLHPQYKAIVAAPPPPPPPPLPPLERSTWTFFNDSAEALGDGDEPPGTDPGESKDTDDSDPNGPWRRPLALSVAGGLLIVGLQLAASGPRPPWSGREANAAPATMMRPAAGPAAPRAAPTVSLVNRRATWLEGDQAFLSTSGATDQPATGSPLAAAGASADTAAAILPAAPRIRTTALLRDAIPKMAAQPKVDMRTVSGMLLRWTAAHDSARARLESGMRVARLNQLFATGRLSPAGGVTETRMSLAGVANFVRVYRQQQTAIDREYQDSFAVTSKQLDWSPMATREWYSKPTLKESPALAALTSSLLEGIDSLFGVLDAQAGTYTVTKNKIRFEDPGAAREYAALRQRITAAVDSARAAGGEASPGPMNYLLQAIGTTRLPQAT